MPDNTTPVPATAAVPAEPQLSSNEAGATLAKIFGLALVVVVVFVIAENWDRWTGSLNLQRTEDAYLQTDITSLGAKVSGYVLEAPVGDYVTVKQGQVLVSLVPDDYKVQLAQQDASVQAAIAALRNNGALVDLQRANIDAARAAVDSASAVVARNRREALRQQRLAREGAGTQQAEEDAATIQQQSEAMFAQSRAQLGAVQRQLEVLAAQKAQAEATLAAAHAAHDAAALDLGYTRIVAPTDGITGQRQVRKGQFVAVGQQVAVLAALPHVWVLANFKENQIRKMRVGQPCEIAVDAFPGRKLAGHVQSFAPGTGSQFALLPPDNATGNFTKVVQRVGVKISIDDAGDLRDVLRPGLSVSATVRTDE